MSFDNRDAYSEIEMLVEYPVEGFDFVIASEPQQEEVIAHYSDSKDIAIYDYKKHHGSYYFSNLDKFINAHPHAKIYFLQNFHLSIRDGDDIQRLNFSRDMLARLGKAIIFLMTQRVDDFIAIHAIDFYSFVRPRIHFQEEATPPEALGDYGPIAIDPGLDADDVEQADFAQPRGLLHAEAVSLSNTALRLASEYRYRDALPMFVQASKISERLFGMGHPRTADVYNNIAKVFSATGNYSKSLEWHRKAFEIFEKALGEVHQATAESCNNIGEVYRLGEEFETALEWHNKAMAIREKALGREHPVTANSYNNTGIVCSQRGDFAMAQDLFAKAMAIREKTLGMKHPDTAGVYKNIANVYYFQGDYSKSLEWRRKALEILEKVLGGGRPETAEAYIGFGRVYNRQGDYANALVWFLKGYRAFRELGESLARTIEARTLLEEAYSSAAERAEQLEEWYEPYEGWHEPYVEFLDPFEEWLRKNL